MTITRRNMLAGAGAAAASTLLSRAAGAQSFPFSPNQRYPDPAVQILDPSFAKYRIYSSTVEQVTTGMRWAEGPAYFPEGGYLLFSDIPNNRIMKFDEKTGQTSVFRSPCQLRQRQRARPPGPPRHLRAFGDPTHHAHREGRQDHGAGRQIRGQAAERAERHRGQVRRFDLVHRSVVRHQRRVGGQEGKARAGHHQRLSHRQGRQDHGRPHRSRQSQRACVLAGRKEALCRRVEGHAQPQHLELRRQRRRHAGQARPR